MALSQTEEQCSLMRNLGTSAVAVEVGAVPEIRALSKTNSYRLRPARGRGVSLCVDGGQTRGSLRGVLETAAVLSHFEGTG